MTDSAPRRAPIPNAYHLMSAAQKRTVSLARMREPAVVCPLCDVHTTSRDLIAHLASRCPGRRDPHPSSAWVTRSEAMKLGVEENRLSRWVEQGLVRSNDAEQEPRYLLRDLATCCAWRALVRAARQQAEPRSSRDERMNPPLELGRGRGGKP